MSLEGVDVLSHDPSIETTTHAGVFGVSLNTTSYDSESSTSDAIVDARTHRLERLAPTRARARAMRALARARSVRSRALTRGAWRATHVSSNESTVKEEEDSDGEARARARRANERRERERRSANDARESKVGNREEDRGEFIEMFGMKTRSDVAAVCLTSAILMTAHSCASPVLPMLATEFGASATEIGATMSAFAAGRLMFNIPCGAFADAYGRRPLMIAGPAVTTIGMIWSYSSAGLGELLAARAVAGVGSSMFMSGATAMLADLSTQSTRARILGANQAAVLAGAAAGPALGGAIAGADGMSIRSPFLAVAGLSSLAMAHSYFKIAETRPAATAADDDVKPSKHWYCDGHPIENPTQVLEGEGALSGAGASAARDRDAAMGRLVKSVDFWSVCSLNAALFFSGAGGRGTLLPILAYHTFGFTPDALGALFSAMAMTSLVGLAPSAAITDAMGRKAVIAPCVVASAASVALMGTTADPLTFIAASILWAAAGSLMGTAPAAYAADISPQNIRGSALGIYRTCGDVGLLLGPLALGAIADSAGVPTALGANAAILAVAGGVFHLTARENKRGSKLLTSSSSSSPSSSSSSSSSP